MILSSSSVDIVPVWRLIPEQNAGEGALMIMRDGSFRTIMRVYPINFDMKAEIEQDAILDVFGELLDSLATDFPLQMVVHRKRLDPEAYFQQFEPRLRDPQTPDLVRRLIEDHKNHFARQVRSYNLLNTEFYIVVSFGVDGVQVGERVSDSLPAARLFRSFSKAAENRILRPPDALDVNVAYQQLELRIAQVRGHLERIDIHCEMLGEQATVDLLYEFMHPGLSERQKLRDAAHTRGILSLGGDLNHGGRSRPNTAPRPRTAVRSSTPQLLRGDNVGRQSSDEQRPAPRRARRVGPSQTKPVRLPTPDTASDQPPRLENPGRAPHRPAVRSERAGPITPAPAVGDRRPEGSTAAATEKPVPRSSNPRAKRGKAPNPPASASAEANTHPAGKGPNPQKKRAAGAPPEKKTPTKPQPRGVSGTPSRAGGNGSAGIADAGAARADERPSAGAQRGDLPAPNLKAETARRSRKRPSTK